MGPFEKVNAMIMQWGTRKLSETKSSGKSMGIVHRADSSSENNSLDNLSVKYTKRAGDLITAIVFKLRRSLFYAYHGAGRGQGGTKGSTWYNAAGERKRTASSSLGQAGAPPRQAKHFLDTISDDADELIDDVGAATCDAIFNNAFKRNQ